VGFERDIPKSQTPRVYIQKCEVVTLVFSLYVDLMSIPVKNDNDD